MEFCAANYGSSVAAILELDGAGHRTVPLVAGRCTSNEARQRLRNRTADQLFPASRAPEAALAGLWFYFSCFTESHAVVQELQSVEGAYWHGILHRQEPDNWNSKYWFRQVGPHPIHATLLEEATQVAARQGARLSVPSPWDAFWFADLCDAAAHNQQHPHLEEALAIQLAEWQHLFHYCAVPVSV